MSRQAEESLSNGLGVARNDLSVLVTHLLLVVGIVFFGWEIGELVFVYLIELGVTYLLFTLAALFAAQPVDDGDAEKWQGEPTPIGIAPFLPPLYERNLGLVARGLLTGGSVFCAVSWTATSMFDWSLSSLTSLPVVLTILAVCGSQLAHVWRQFLADGSYRDRSPGDAIEIAFRPIGRLVVIAFYVIAPITAVYGFTTIVLLDVESASALPYGNTFVLLLYVVPIGAASVWLRNDRFEVGLEY
jgi:hypothetical protein